MVWGLRTQPCKSIGQTPFSLVYGSEAILPADILWQSARLETYEEGEADEARHLELDTARRTDATQWYNLPAICKESGVITVAMYSKNLSASETWSYVRSRMKDSTSSIQDGKDHFLYPR